MKTFITDGGYKIERVSRWIKIKYKYITPRHSLFDYASKNENLLVYFTFKNKDYALNQFIRFDNPWTGLDPLTFMENNKHIVVGFDSTDCFNTLLVEENINGEAVRLYRYVQ